MASVNHSYTTGVLVHCINLYNCVYELFIKLITVYKFTVYMVAIATTTSENDQQ